MKSLSILLVAVLTLLLIHVPEAQSVLSSPVATVSDTLDPGESTDYPYTIPNNLDNYLLHVEVEASNPETDRLDITIEGDSWTDLQGDWWDAWGPLAAGDHTLTAAAGPDAANQVTFTVQFYEVPTPPFTVEGEFPAAPYNDAAYIYVNLPEAGYYPISVNAKTGNLALLPGDHDPIDVFGPTKRTLQFSEADVYEFQIQADVLGENEVTAWSLTIESPTSKPSLEVEITEGCRGVGPGLSCIFRADATASDGGQPDIQYSWTTTGGCFINETGTCVTTFQGQYSNWTAPETSSEQTYEVTVEAAANGYENGKDSWPVVVPEFSSATLALAASLLLGTVLILRRTSKVRASPAKAAI